MPVSAFVQFLTMPARIGPAIMALIECFKVTTYGRMEVRCSEDYSSLCLFSSPCRPGREYRQAGVPRMPVPGSKT
jgi:hypothetical protein